MFISQNSFKAWGPGWGEIITVVLSVKEFLKFETILLIFFPLLGAQFKVQPQTTLQRAVPDSLMIKFSMKERTFVKV